MFIEDGSDREEENVLSLKLKNLTDETLVRATLIFTDENGEEYTFSVNTIPAGKQVTVLEIHAKDFRKVKFGEESDGLVTRGCNFLHGCVVGEGDIPAKQCIAILKKAGYDGFVSIEYEGSEDCIEALAKGLANLKSYI